MIAEQKRIIEEFKRLKKDQAVKKVAKELGVERSRYCRILNGHEMKLSEYWAMKGAINEILNLKIIDEVEDLSVGMRNELSLAISRNKRMQKLLKGGK